MVTPLSREEKIKRGAEDAGRYFRYIAEFVGFTQDDANTIKESGLIIEKYLPEIVSQFYAHLLRYPPTRKHFLKKDGTIDRDYVQLRMHHLTNFWRRTAAGKYDDDYARYIDYVGRAHTSRGADPNIYIAERYVIGQVGFMQHAISQALTKELHEIDPDLETRALRAWNLLMMVILEILARAYTDEHEIEPGGSVANIDPQAVFNLALETYEFGLGIREPTGTKEILIGTVQEIPDGERKLVQLDELSIGVFHYQGGWYALRNSCLHRGGPVCTGTLKGDVLTCPWHGYQYNVTNGQLLVDPTAKLASYPVQVREGVVYVQVPVIQKEMVDLSITEGPVAPEEKEKVIKKNEFYIHKIAPGDTKLVYLGNDPVAVYNVGGTFYATQNQCTHAEGPLSEGDLDGNIVTCPLHGSRFDVTTGQVIEGPADEPLKRFRVIIEGEIGRVEKL
jgi:nitrite reductase/ring-hydroxylating ferredoxin subunit